MRVVTPNGLRPEVAVSVEEKNGHIQEQEPTSKDAQFCDLGGLPVTVRVGYDGSCNQVIVREVPVVWREPYLLRVMYDPTPCNRDLPRPPVPVCRMVFRVSGSDGKWLERARIEILQPTLVELRTDKFGRASLVAKADQEVRGSVSMGDRVADFRSLCDKGERVHEQAIMVH